MNGQRVCELVVSAVIFSCSPVFAGDSSSLEEIIVTAQKRAERTIDVPMSLTVVSSEDMEKRGIRSIEDLSFAVPGVVLREDGPGSLEVYMRGVGNLAGAEALTAVYMDETPTTLYLFRQLDLRSLDIDHVEVLKGPQGTLYGQGAADGTIRFITRKPVLDQFEARVEGDFSSIEHGDMDEKMTGIVNVPILDNVLAVRVAATGEKGGGWINQPQAGIKNGNNQDLYNIRTEGLWRPLDALEIKGTVAAYRLTSELGLDYEDANHDISIGIDRARKLRPRLDRYQLYNLTATYDLGFASITSASSYIDYLRHYALPYITPVESRYDPVGGNLEGISTYDDQTYQFTQEVRLVSKGDQVFNYTVGAFYRDVKSDFVGPIETLYNGVVLAPYIYTSDNASKSWSVFADGSVKLGERFEVGAGVRSFKDDSSIFDGSVTQSATFQSTDPRVYVSYAVNGNNKLYATVAKGFRSGGFNGEGQPAYSPEHLINYEIGAKGTLPDSRLTYELAAYYTNYKDMIKRGLVVIDQKFLDIQANIGTAHIKGVEAALTWRPIDRLSLSATGAYTSTELVQINATNTANEVGDPLDYVPKWAYTFAADYRFQWSSGVPGFGHVDFDHRDPVRYTDRQMYYPAYVTQSSDTINVVGARIGATLKKTTVELYVNNLTGQNKSLDPFAIWSQGNRTRPRTIGIKASYEF